MLVGSSSTPNLSFIGIVDFSQEARWIYMTESVADLLGYEPRDLVGRPSLELVHPDEFPRVKQLHYDTIRQDKAAVLVYLRMKHKDPLKGYVLCGVSRTVVHNVLVGSVSFANPNKALQNASTAQEITVIAPEARNFQFRRWHDPSPMPPSPIPEPMRVLPAAFLKELESYGNGLRGNGGAAVGGGATIEYVDIPDRRYEYAPSPPRSPSPPPPPQQQQQSRYASSSYRSPSHVSSYDRDDDGYHSSQRDYEYDYDYDRNYEHTRGSSSGAHTATSAHITSQESYARRRSPSYPPSPASPVYTPQSPSVDSHRRLSRSSSSSGSSSGSSRLVRSGISGVNLNGVHGTNGVDADADVGGGRRLGHSTSWTRRRIGSATPTPGADRDRYRDGDKDTDMDRDQEDERRRERERGMARDLEEEERSYRERERERYLTPEAARDRDSRDLATNRYYSPDAPLSPPAHLNNGANGHEHSDRNGRRHADMDGRHGVSHSLTPSPPPPPLSTYRHANAPASPTYASVARDSPPRRPPLPGSPRLLHQPLISPPVSAPPRQVTRPRDPSPVITFDHLPAQSSRTAFILDRFTDKSSIMFCSNTLLICPASPSAGSPSLTASPVSPTAPGQRRSGSPPGYSRQHNRGRGTNGNANANGNGNTNGNANTSANETDELAQANAIGRPFFDFVAPRDEQIVRDWIACVKGWGVNEKGQPSDGGFGFGRFGLVKEGRESAPRNPDPAPTSRGGRNRRGSTSGRGRTTGAPRRGIDQSGRRRPGGSSSGTSASAPNNGGSSPPGASGGDSDAEREAQRQRQREAEATVIQVDAIFSAHSDGLMVILRRAA